MTYNNDDEFFQNLEKYQEKLTQKFNHFRRSSKSDITSNTNDFELEKKDDCLKRKNSFKKNDENKTEAKAGNIIPYKLGCTDPEITLSQIASFKSKKIIKKKEKKQSYDKNQTQSIADEQNKDLDSHDKIEIKNGQIELVSHSKGKTLNYTYTKNDDENLKVSSHSFKKMNNSSKKKIKAKWSVKETRLFYKSLSYFGTEFSIIARIFDHKNEKQIKSKYNNEMKKNSEEIDKCLKKRKEIPAEFKEKIHEINKQIQEKSDVEITPSNLSSHIILRNSRLSMDSCDLNISEYVLENINQQIETLNEEKQSRKYDAQNQFDV